MAWAQTPSPSPSPTPPADQGPDWTIASAPARLIIEQDHPDQPAAITSVNLCLPDPKWLDLPIRVFTDKGLAVGSDLLWTAPGEPATLLFDSSSGARQYKIYLGTNWPALHLDHPTSGVILETRSGDGKSVDHLPDMLQAWNQSKTTYGRALLDGVFEGGHRFAPQGNVLSHFQGWFDVAAPEHLQLVTISNDASFVLVDGKEVVEWPGLHDFHPGLGGQFQGAVDLTPGIHQLEYYNAYREDKVQNHPALSCLAANGGPLKDWTMLRPEAHFFRPTGRAHVVDYQLETGPPGETAAGGAPAFALDWTIQGQSVLSSDIPDLGLISVQLTCRPTTTGTVTWTFDDGTTAQGDSVQHLFPRPGMRTVQISVKEGEKNLGAVGQTIHIHPNWTQLTTNPPQLTPEHLTDLMGRDPATFPASDLGSCMAVFGVFKNSDGLLKILPAVCDKMKAMNEADLPYLGTAAIYLADNDLLHFTEETRLLQSLVDRCTADKPSPQLIATGSKARLSLAQLTLKTTDHLDAVKSLLDGIDPPSLTGDEHRASDILRADLALAAGNIPGAKKQYEALTGDPSGADQRSSIRRTARIGQARAFLNRKDFESAENALQEVAVQSPIEKMSPDWALTRLRLFQEEGLPGAAYLWATRLLPVLTDSNRSELLFRLTDLAFAQGHDDVAKKALSELLQKHPYSSEAAQAKEKWPGKV
jgi:tetratricopeptide (TPR) repeat protein